MKITLNLIPSYEKEKLLQGKRFRTAVRWEFGFSILLGFFILMLVSVNYILSLEASLALEKRINGKEYEKVEEFQKGTKEINNLVSELEKIQKGQLYWSHLLEVMNKNIPEGIMLENLSTKEYGVSFSGRSKTRDKIVIMKEVLEREKCVSELNFPLSNLISKEDVNFQINFKLKKECLLSND